MSALPKRGPGGKFLPRTSGAKTIHEPGTWGHGWRSKEQQDRELKKNRRKNSAELLILGNPRKRTKLTPEEDRAWEKAFQFHVDAGKSSSRADRAAWRDIAKEFPRLKGFKGAKPNSRKRRKLNPDQMQEAIELYEKFHGKAPAEILEIQESAGMRQEYAGLGDLVSLLVRDAAKKTIQFDFTGDGVKVAAAPKGKQIYFLGGNQNIGASLGQFEADATKDFIELGECTEIVYTSHKEFDKFKTIDYVHEFGEEGGARPTLIYARLARRLMLAGGDYVIDAPGIIN